MSHFLRRALSSLVMVFTMLGAIPAGASGALAASVATTALPVPAPDPVAEFRLVAFPHETALVHFYDSWGARRSGGRRHRGIDIHSPKGTPIVAVADGVIIHMGSNRLSGWNLKIEHVGGWVSSYVHLNNDNPGSDDGEGGARTAFARGLEIGDAVQAGDVVGYVGDSGNAEHTVPHTHFELRHDGDKLNPYEFLLDAWEEKMRRYHAGGTAVESPTFL